MTIADEPTGDPRPHVIYHIDTGIARSRLGDYHIDVDIVDKMLKDGLLIERDEWITVSTGGWDFYKARLRKDGTII